MKTASIYKRSGKGYLVYSLTPTFSGGSISSEPFINIPEIEADAEAIAAAIKTALCNDDSLKVPLPKNWSEFNKNFLKKTGLKSFKELENSKTKLISITEDGGKISFLPTRPAQKPDKGFLHMSENEAIVVPANASNQEIVVAYELALSKCG
jgi:hypothetical protein